MLNLFGEGLATAFFPCTLVLAVPGLAVTLAGRRFAGATLGAFLAALILGSWLRFAGWIDVMPSLITGAGLLLAAALVTRGDGDRSLVMRAIAGVGAGVATGSLWRPCVGIEFGEVLTNLDTAGPVGLVQMIVYTVGVTAPLIALAGASHAAPSTWSDRIGPALGWFGGGVLALLGLAVIAGLDERVINRLFQLSSF